MLIYFQQKRNARGRGIEFSISFDDWWRIWQDSGHWDDRGRLSKQYVMARKGDVGPYSKDNVKIVTHADNVREFHTGKYVSPKTRAILRKNALGNKNGLGKTPSKETRAKISRANKGRVFSPQHRRKLSDARLDFLKRQKSC
jgi:Zn-finger nucleic acid-binding protein